MPDPNPAPETIIAAALKEGDKVYSLPPPHRHHTLAHSWPGTFKQSKQGFITSTGRFVDRKEAWIIARAANQVGDRTHVKGTLFTEDLW